MIEKITKLMEKIEYGVPGPNNENLLKIYDEDKVFDKMYYLQTPEELLKSKIGVCWDQVELERKYFEEINIKTESYWICTYDKDNFPSHTFLTYKKDGKYYWFENSWGEYKGAHEYISLNELLKDIKEKFIKSHKTNKLAETLIYKYKKPEYHITCSEFYQYIETQEKIKIN